jgi:metallophosphoesterase superfamily enzyme
MEGRLVSSWEAITKDNEGEAHVHTLHKYDHLPEVPKDAFITQAPPIKITPSKSKPVERGHRLIAVLPDEQIGYRNIRGELIPLHDERAMSVARSILRDLRPDTIVGNGDTGDQAELSRFTPDSDHFIRTLQPTIDRQSRWDAELAADNPNAKRVRLAGNHDRLTKFILKNTMQLYGLRRANMPEELPVLTIPYLVRAEETGWQYITGYPANEFRYADDLVFVHGNKVRSGGSTAELMSKTYQGRSVVFGHVHRHESHSTTDWKGNYHTAVSFGTLARIDGVVPSYGNGVDDHGNPVERYENWQNGIGVIYDYQDSYEFNFIPIINGVARYRGKQYGA